MLYLIVYSFPHESKFDTKYGFRLIMYQTAPISVCVQSLPLTVRGKDCLVHSALTLVMLHRYQGIVWTLSKGRSSLS